MNPDVALELSSRDETPSLPSDGEGAASDLKRTQR